MTYPQALIISTDRNACCCGFVIAAIPIASCIVLDNVPTSWHMAILKFSAHHDLNGADHRYGEEGYEHSVKTKNGHQFPGVHLLVLVSE